MNQLVLNDVPNFAEPAMSESTVTEIPKRQNKIAEEKARLRAELAGMVDRVPQKVNAGSVQTTREWVSANTKARRATTRQRISRHDLRKFVDAMREWAA